MDEVAFMLNYSVCMNLVYRVVESVATDNADPVCTGFHKILAGLTARLR